MTKISAKKNLEESKSEFEPLTQFVKELLGDRVQKMIASTRIVESPCLRTLS